MLWQPMSWRLLAHSHMLGITSICLMFQSSKSCFALCQLMCFCFPAFNGWVTGPLFKNISIRVKSLYLPFLSTIFINSMIIHIYINSNTWCSFFITYTEFWFEFVIFNSNKSGHLWLQNEKIFQTEKWVYPTLYQSNIKCHLRNQI